MGMTAALCLFKLVPDIALGESNMMRIPVSIGILAAAVLAAFKAGAVTAVDPDTINVNRIGVTTVFLTFRGTKGQKAADAFWCLEITVPANTPVARDPCVPGTLLGHLPGRHEYTSSSSAGREAAIVDIMTIPASVARRVYQQALAGKVNRFYYVRKFVDSGGREEYIAVTCRLAGGGAGVPLALTRVEVGFETAEGRKAVYLLSRGQLPPPVTATLFYNGSGRLKGRWEVVRPGDPQPRIQDLMTEASLPPEARGRQRRYQLLSRFDVFLPPVGKAVLPGPDPKRIPTAVDGPYEILLRIEASNAPNGRSETAGGSVPTGGVAGFPMPVLRYFVGGSETLAPLQRALAHEELVLMFPANGSVITSPPVNLGWKAVAGPDYYLLEVKRSGKVVFSAIIDQGVSSYSLPSFITAIPGDLRWRVSAVSAQGETHARSPWWSLRITRDENPPAKSEMRGTSP